MGIKIIGSGSCIPEAIQENSKFINNYVKADYSAFGGAIKSERSIKIEKMRTGKWWISIYLFLVDVPLTSIGNWSARHLSTSLEYDWSM